MRERQLTPVEGNAKDQLDHDDSDLDIPPEGELDIGLARIPLSQENNLERSTSRGYMGRPLENLARALSNNSSNPPPAEDMVELRPTMSRYKSNLAGLPEEAGTPIKPISQGVPPELGNLLKEFVFVFVCTGGQLFFAFYIGNTTVNQQSLKQSLGLQSAQTPWLVGSFLIANGLSVIVAGSLTDLAPPRLVVVGAFAWLTLWNLIGAFTLVPSRNILFFFMRAMQGLSVGVLVSGSMSILGRVYKPGIRKTRVFSAMAAGAPFGFWLGALQGGALSYHLPWVFGTSAMLSGVLCAAAFFTMPALRPAADAAGSDAPGLRQFDYKGASLAVLGE